MQIGSLAECNGKLLVAEKWGDLHVLTDDNKTWATFVRYHGDIRRVVAFQDTCLVLIKDEVKNHFVIEQFCMDEENNGDQLQCYQMNSNCHVYQLHYRATYCMLWVA